MVLDTSNQRCVNKTVLIVNLCLIKRSIELRMARENLFRSRRNTPVYIDI